jgi:hypothetical protein
VIWCLQDLLAERFADHHEIEWPRPRRCVMSLHGWHQQKRLGAPAESSRAAEHNSRRKSLGLAVAFWSLQDLLAGRFAEAFVDLQNIIEYHRISLNIIEYLRIS